MEDQLTVFRDKLLCRLGKDASGDEWGRKHSHVAEKGEW